MSANLNIFEQLDNDSEDDDFIGVISNAKPTEISKTLSAEPNDQKNIFDALNDIEEEKKYSFLETSRDIGEQIVKKGISGLGGAYGNLLEAIGVQSEENLLPGQKANIESSFEDPYDLGLNDDILPSYARLPTSKDIQVGIESSTGIGEGKTPAGRIAGRASEFIGEGAATGGGAKALIGLGASGLAGQSIREADGPEYLATGTEITGSVIPSIVSGKVMPRSKEAKDISAAGRKLGLTEKQITPLIQGENKVATLSKVARKGTKTKELFASIKESLGDSYQNIKNSVANYGNVNAANRQILIDKFSAIKNDLQKTLKASPDKEAAINFIQDAIEKVSKNGATPEELINFWQDINKSVKWNSIQGGKKSLSRLKEPIQEVLNNVSPIAAKDFEMTNQLYSKYSQISKKLKPDLIDSIVSKGEILAAGPAALALVYGNPSVLGALASESAIRLLSREMLINPYFQNLGTKLVTNFNQSSLKGVTELVKNAQEYLQRKHPEEDWSFLTNN